MRICFSNLNVTFGKFGAAGAIQPPAFGGADGRICLNLLQTLPKRLKIAEICEQSTYYTDQGVF